MRRLLVGVMLLFLAGCSYVGVMRMPDEIRIRKATEAAVFPIKFTRGKDFKLNDLEKEYVKWMNIIYKNYGPEETEKLLMDNGLKEISDKVVNDFLANGTVDKAEIKTIGEELGVRHIVISEVFSYRTCTLIGYEERNGLGVASIETETGKVDWKVFDSVNSKGKSRILVGKLEIAKRQYKFSEKASSLKGTEKQQMEEINKDCNMGYFATLDMLTLKRTNVLALNLLFSPVPLIAHESRMMLAGTPSMNWVVLNGYHDEAGKELKSKFGGGIEINILKYFGASYVVTGDGRAYMADFTMPFSLEPEGTQNFFFTTGVGIGDPDNELELLKSQTIYNRLYWMNSIADIYAGYAYVFEEGVIKNSSKNTAEVKVGDQSCYAVGIVYPSKMYRSTFGINLSAYEIYFKDLQINGTQSSDRRKVYIVPALRAGNMEIKYGKQVAGGSESLYSLAVTLGL